MWCTGRVAGTIEHGREAFERQAWGDAFVSLADAVEPEDLERLAVAAYLVGRDEQSDASLERAHHAWRQRGSPDGAARCAFWLGFSLLLRGESARSGGWLARAGRTIDDAGADCVTRGWLLVPAALESLHGGDPATAFERSSEAAEIARRFGDADLLAFGWLGQGEASIARGEVAQGVRHLDEVMVAVTTTEVSARSTGILYCAVIGACIGVFDLARAAEWTEALRAWCDAQPDLVPYRGQCLVHRSQILQAHGEWEQAADEAQRACDRLSEPLHPTLGAALYERAEVHRLRGELDRADEVYRAAGEHGMEAAPGLPLLRLAQGRVEVAAASIRRMADEPPDPLARPGVLAACVEITIAAGDLDAARAASEELAELAQAGPFLQALAAHATGCVRLAEGDPSGALGSLRRAATGWRQLGMRFDAARAGVSIGLACRALGDEDAAAVELHAARVAFERLGAGTELARLDRLEHPGPEPTPPRRLTERECEVLRLVAAGRTNRQIGAELVISEHTVARHVQNIFTKLGVSSRAAATAHAYEQHLV